VSVLQAAIAWHNAGVSVIPIRKDGSKAPALKSWKEYQTRLPTFDELIAWFAHDQHALAAVCGAVSGNLELIELEGRAVAAGASDRLDTYAEDNALTHVIEAALGSYVQSSPSGGLHLVYRVAGPVAGNQKLARADKRTVLAETRGEGGYFILAPSGDATHATGRPWQVRAGSPSSLATLSIDDRDALAALVHMLDEYVPEEPLHETGGDGLFTSATAGTRPGDDFNAKAKWEDILGPHGWTVARRMGNGYAWRRPGKTDPGISATTGQAADGVDRLYVFSSSTEFEPERPYSKFAVHALLEHHGDYTAAAKALSAAGYGTQPTIAVETHSATQSVAAVTHVPEGQTVTETLPETRAHDSADAPTSTLAMSEDGHAQHLIAEFGDTIRYWEDSGKWLHWDGWRWRKQSAGGGIVREYAKFVARTYPDDKQWLTHKRRCLSAAGTSACLTQASTDHRITVNTEALDAHPWELNTPGGIIDLRTGTLQPADPAKLHTRITRCAPDFTADRSAWLAFLDTTFQGDAELIGWMQRLLGYAALGVVLENILPVFYGATGANGKTVLLDTVMAILGDYAAPAPKGFLLAGAPKHDTEIADLAGVRMVVSSETNTGERFDEGKVKLLTGGDRLKARFMRQDFFHFTPSHTVFLMSNHRPEVTAGGSAFWRRIREVPFDHQIPKEQRDGTLKDRLVADHGPAILAWIAEGAAQYAATGLAEPSRVHAATNDYERDTDTVARFVEDVCIIGGGEHVKVKSVAVTSAYEAWCRSEGETPVTAKTLLSGLRGRYPIGSTRSHGLRFLTNLTLSGTDEADEATRWGQ
jgi:putative DNA primase/helicase